MKKYEKYHARNTVRKKCQNKKGENILLKKFVILCFHMRKSKIVNTPNDFLTLLKMKFRRIKNIG